MIGFHGGVVEEDKAGGCIKPDGRRHAKKGGTSATIPDSDTPNRCPYVLLQGERRLSWGTIFNSREASFKPIIVGMVLVSALGQWA